MDIPADKSCLTTQLKNKAKFFLYLQATHSWLDVRDLIHDHFTLTPAPLPPLSPSPFRLPIYHHYWGTTTSQ